MFLLNVILLHPPVLAKCINASDRWTLDRQATVIFIPYCTVVCLIIIIATVNAGTKFIKFFCIQTYEIMDQDITTLEIWLISLISGFYSQQFRD